MISISKLGRPLALAALALSLAPATTADSGGPSAGCHHGPAGGLWDLPYSNQQDGRVDGVLMSTNSTVVYNWRATLVNVPSPCLSCIEGTIDGTLDDGVGTGPDYVVTGRYFGGHFSGQGHFRTQIRRPGGTAIVGQIVGTFHDSPFTDGPGTFSGRWRICP